MSTTVGTDQAGGDVNQFIDFLSWKIPLKSGQASHGGGNTLWINSVFGIHFLPMSNGKLFAWLNGSPTTGTRHSTSSKIPWSKWFNVTPNDQNKNGNPCFTKSCTMVFGIGRGEIGFEIGGESGSPLALMRKTGAPTQIGSPFQIRQLPTLQPNWITREPFLR